MKPFRDPVFQRRLRNAARERKSHAHAVTAEALRHANRTVLAAGTNAPPVDLQRLAKHLGVDEIVFTPLAMQGRVIDRGGRTVVEINDGLNPQLREFCLAHELSHLILEQERFRTARVDGSFATRVSAHHDIERLCDICADEILLPAAWLHRRLYEEGGDFRAAVGIGQLAQLEIEYVVERIISLELRPWRAISWGRVRNRIQAIQSIPEWDEAFLVNIDILDESQSPVAKCLAGAEYATGPIRLRIADQDQEYWMEACRRAINDVFSVAYPKKHRQY